MLEGMTVCLWADNDALWDCAFPCLLLPGHPAPSHLDGGNWLSKVGCGFPGAWGRPGRYQSIRAFAFWLEASLYCLVSSFPWAAHHGFQTWGLWHPRREGLSHPIAAVQVEKPCRRGLAGSTCSWVFMYVPVCNSHSEVWVKSSSSQKALLGDICETSQHKRWPKALGES